MAALVCWITGISAPDPYDSIAIDGSAVVEDAGAVFSWSAYADIGASADDIDAACTAAAGTAASGHSYTYGPVKLIGGAPPASCAVPGASTSQSLAASTPRQPSTTRPVMVMLTGSWSWNLSATGTQTGSLSFQSDSSATPTTAIYAPAWSRGISVGLSIGDTGTEPICMSYIVPPGHYYQVVVAGGATFSLREQVL